MSPEEASWFGDVLRSMPAASISPMLNVGSSTLDYRTRVCPHIGRDLFGPLNERGVRIVHADMKPSDGVDIVGDILDRAVRAKVASLGVRSILCNNLLEHVADIPAICEALADMCPPGGIVCLSVPHAYPFHPDPIDNGFRPSPAQLEEIFKPLGLRLLSQAVLGFGSYGRSLSTNPKLLLRDVYLLLLAPFNAKKRRVLVGNYRFLRREYQVTCAVLKKDQTSEGH